MKDDSRKIEVGDTFISLTNNKAYINEAIKKGASKVIVESGLYKVDTLIVKNTREYLINYLDELYKEKFKKIKIIGITGTNGKTTSCYLLWQILNMLGNKCGYIGTIGFYMDKKVKDLNNTTPDILDLYNMINILVDNNYKYVVMEVSSQALSYNRIGKLEYDYAIFTNLTKDHLDYHINMHNYALAKQKLFKQTKIGIVNYDDLNKNYFILDKNTNYQYGEGGNYIIENINYNNNYTYFNFNKTSYKTNLIGHYNIYNLAISLIIMDLENIKYSKELLETLNYPPGRMETVLYGNNKIIVDYAHTPDAVSNVIKEVKKLCPNRIITIIGCGGNRDKSKRSEMGLLSTTLSDYVIFTSDNPRNEDPDEIINDIVKSLDKKNYEIESNREFAIVKGIQMLDKNDILLVLGKGHEDYQIIGNKKNPFSDIEVIKNNL